MHFCPRLCSKEKESVESLVIVLISNPLESKNVRTLSLRVNSSSFPLNVKFYSLKIKKSLFLLLNERSLRWMMFCNYWARQDMLSNIFMCNLYNFLINFKYQLYPSCHQSLILFDSSQVCGSECALQIVMFFGVAYAAIFWSQLPQVLS